LVTVHSRFVGSTRRYPGRSTETVILPSVGDFQGAEVKLAGAGPGGGGEGIVEERRVAGRELKVELTW
jgi:hypothetical protein